jgi:hypothetical protein
MNTPPPPSYRREFAKSPLHAWLALATLGLGFLSAMPLFLIAGVTAYALGWIYAPDFDFFRRWVDRRHQAAEQAALQKQLTEFLRKRETLLAGLSPSRRERYRDLAEVCRNIESASAENPGSSPTTDPRLRRLDELMWTFLRLLSIEESLERFLETERRDDVPNLLQAADAEMTRLNTDIEALKAQGNTTALEARQRLLGSRQDRLEVLKKRLQRIEQARENLALVVSEQERLDQQIKLIRADAVASRNAEALSARIDATVEHLDQTNKWLSEMDEFKDLVGDLPVTEARVGFDPAPVPPALTAGSVPPTLATPPPLAQRSVPARVRIPKPN